jgi:dolichol-phosphate mannosyltransferase
MAFNEVASLEAVVVEILAVAGRRGEPHEVLIVDDGSADGTGLLADRLARDWSVVRVVHHGSNQGLGAVYRTGFSEARGDIITFFPADGQFAASHIERFRGAMMDADVVLGCLGSGRRSLAGRILSAGERLLYRLLFGRFPQFQGIVMFRRALLDSIDLRSRGRGWAVLMELIIRASRAGYRIRNLQIDLRPRIAGRSKVQNPRTVWSNFRQTLELRRHL